MSPKKNEIRPLKKMGILKSESYRWRMITAIPQDLFDELMQRKELVIHDFLVELGEIFHRIKRFREETF